MAKWKVYQVGFGYWMSKRNPLKLRFITWDGTIIESETAEEAADLRREQTKLMNYSGDFVYKRYHAIPVEWEVPKNIKYKQLEFEL